VVGRRLYGMTNAWGGRHPPDLTTVVGHPTSGPTTGSSRPTGATVPHEASCHRPAEQQLVSAAAGQTPDTAATGSAIGHGGGERV